MSDSIIIALSLTCGILISIGLVRWLFIVKPQPPKEKTRPELFLDKEGKKGAEGKGDLEELISAFNKMLDSLRRSEVYVENIIQNMADSLIITDLEGKITRVNRATELLLGYNEAEIKGKSIRSLFVEGDKLTIEEGLIKASSDLSYLAQNGRPIPVSVKCSELKLAGGEPIGAVTIGRDLREMKKLIDNLAKANEELKELDELKSDFVSIASHELRAPLTSIKGFSDLLLDKVVGEVNEKQHRYLTKISTNTDRLARLIDNLLSISKIEAGRLKMPMKLLLIEPLIDEVIASLMPQWKEKELKVNAYYPEELPAVYISPDGLRQVMINLLNNAIKFTPREGQINITVVEKETHLEIKVSDTGVGIAPENRERVFKKFYQVTPSAEGTGLGLAITKGLVESLNGKIWIEGEVSKGTTVGFTVPKRQ